MVSKNYRGGALPKNFKMIIALFLAVILLAVIYVTYRKYTVEKFEADKKVKIVLVHASWCPHCTDYIESGVFKRAGKEISNMSQFAGKVEFTDVEYEANKAQVEKYGVNGFPSIIAVNEKGEKILDFTSFRNDPKPDRSSIEDLTDFVEAALKA